MSIRTIAQKTIDQLVSQGDIAKCGAGKHGVSACEGNSWDCLGNLIYRIAVLEDVRPMPLMEELDPLITELFPGRELAPKDWPYGEKDPTPPTGFRKVYMFNDHADTTLDDELLLLRTWLERNPA